MADLPKNNPSAEAQGVDINNLVGGKATFISYLKAKKEMFVNLMNNPALAQELNITLDQLKSIGVEVATVMRGATKDPTTGEINLLPDALQPNTDLYKDWKALEKDITSKSQMPQHYYTAKIGDKQDIRNSIVGENMKGFITRYRQTNAALKDYTPDQKPKLAGKIADMKGMNFRLFSNVIRGNNAPDRDE